MDTTSTNRRPSIRVVNRQDMRDTLHLDTQVVGTVHLASRSRP